MEQPENVITDPNEKFEKVEISQFRNEEPMLLLNSNVEKRNICY